MSKLTTLILLACWLPCAASWVGGSYGCGGSGQVSLGASESPNQRVVYYLDDHLGNANLLVDENGNVLREEGRYPYGLDRKTEGSAPADYVYTGKELDEETGLVYFGGRYYVPELGRWASPDPKYLNAPSAIAENPHAANLYSYALNNPSNFIDPDGFEPWPKSDFPNASIVPQNAAERAFTNRITNGVSEVSTMLIPGVNDVRDAYEFKIGRDLITNESIGWGGRVAAGVGLIVGSGAAYREAAAFIHSSDDKIVRLGLGLSAGPDRIGYREWSRQHGFSTWADLSSSGSFKNQFQEAADKAGEIHFNLQGVDVTRANTLSNEFGEPMAGYTNYELGVIKEKYMNKATWWNGETRMSPEYDPFK